MCSSVETYFDRTPIDTGARSFYDEYKPRKGDIQQS